MDHCASEGRCVMDKRDWEIVVVTVILNALLFAVVIYAIGGVR